MALDGASSGNGAGSSSGIGSSVGSVVGGGDWPGGSRSTSQIEATVLEWLQEYTLRAGTKLPEGAVESIHRLRVKRGTLGYASLFGLIQDTQVILTTHQWWTDEKALKNLWSHFVRLSAVRGSIREKLGSTIVAPLANTLLRDELHYTQLYAGLKEVLMRQALWIRFERLRDALATNVCEFVSQLDEIPTVVSEWDRINHTKAEPAGATVEYIAMVLIRLRDMDEVKSEKRAFLTMIMNSLDISSQIPQVTESILDFLAAIQTQGDLVVTREGVAPPNEPVLRAVHNLTLSRPEKA